MPRLPSRPVSMAAFVEWKFLSFKINHSKSCIFKTLGILQINCQDFWTEIFSRDGFQSIRIDRKHDGFGDRTRPCTHSDRLAKHYLVLFSPELVISRRFTQLLRSHQRLNKGALKIRPKERTSIHPSETSEISVLCSSFYLHCVQSFDVVK